MHISRYTTHSFQSGSALIVVMVLFVAVSLSIAIGLVAPVLHANRIATNSITSKQSYLAAESGVEDVVYRVLTAQQFSPTESLVVGTATAETAITDTGSRREIESVGDAQDRNRIITVSLTQGVGAAFNYGVQTGRGGVTMGNGASIIGNIYANGNISGGAVTGSAIAANSAALVADQINDTPTIPSSSITFRNTSGTADIAQSFQVSTSGPINKIAFYIKKVGTPANATVRIVTDASGSPSTNNLLSTQGTFSASTVTTSYGWNEVVFPSNPTLTAGTTYWVIIDSSSVSGSNYYILGANTGTYTGGSAKVGAYNGSWAVANSAITDTYFKVYLGGLTSTISNVAVGGAGGDAWAHTITGGSVAGIKYCQVGTGCNTTRTDPSPAPFPISDAMIASWKDDALAGGTSGTTTINSNTTSLGPRKISGDLVVTNNATLIITGTLWVTGNVTIGNNATVKLATTYGTNDGVFIADGRITISNNALFQNSGTAGSYILALTTSDCPTSSSCSGNYAIEMSNNAGAVILNAQKGTIHVNNNANLTQATAEKLLLDNNVTVTYVTGLANMNFTSGPQGGWNIAYWKETQ